MKAKRKTEASVRKCIKDPSTKMTQICTLSFVSDLKLSFSMVGRFRHFEWPGHYFSIVLTRDQFTGFCLVFSKVTVSFSFLFCWKFMLFGPCK